VKKILICITVFLVLFFAGCVPSSQNYRPDDLGYDREQQYDYEEQLVEDELRRQEAVELDSQTRRDIDRAVEENR